MENELIKLAQSDHGKVLMNYLGEKIKEMADITKVKDYNDLVGKQEAVKILKELFNFLEKAKEKPTVFSKTDYR